MRTHQEYYWLHTAAASAMGRKGRGALALLAALAVSPGADAQEGGTGGRAAQATELDGLPPPNYPTSPHRGVIDGWTGKPIPCRCRFDGRSFELGSVVCMSTHVGTVLTRCDIVGNNTSWMPSREPCTPKAGS
jgi:hypothetical protein